VLHQVSLNTGEIRHRDRAIIPIDILPGALEAIHRMVQKNTCIPMSFDGGDWLLAGHAEDRTLTITLWRGTWVKRVLFLSAGTAPDLLSGKALWDRLHEAGTATGNKPPCEAPWTVDRFEPVAAFHPAEAQWLSDFSAVIGWAWLAYLKQTEEHPVH
jgi:hypothetical protein